MLPDRRARWPLVFESEGERAETWEGANVNMQPRTATLTSYGGAEGDRTPDLMTASHALSQLSYGPSGWEPVSLAERIANGERIWSICGLTWHPAVPDESRGGLWARGAVRGAEARATQ